MTTARFCNICGLARPDEYTVGAPLRQHGHRLYLVAVGTTWRFAWALNPTGARRVLGQIVGAKAMSLRARDAQVREATEADLLTREEFMVGKR